MGLLITVTANLLDPLRQGLQLLGTPSFPSLQIWLPIHGNTCITLSLCLCLLPWFHDDSGYFLLCCFNVWLLFCWEAFGVFFEILGEGRRDNVLVLMIYIRVACR